MQTRLTLCCIWPFLALIYSVVNHKKSYSKNIIWFFSGFLGYTFVISNDGMDANRYRDALKRLYQTELGLGEFYLGVVDGTYGRGDFLEPTIRYFISCFSDDHRILFTFYGLVMGYFFSRNIWFFLDKVRGKINLISLPFLLLIIFTIPIWQINGFRFWTAAHIFIYGVITHSNQKSLVKSLAIVLLSILTHIAFVVPIGIYLMHLLIKKNRTLLLTTLTVSLFLLQVDIPFLLQFIPDNMAGPGEMYIDGYLKSDKAQNMVLSQNSQRWFLRLNQIILPLAFSILSYFYLLFKHKNYKNSSLGSLATFAILTFAIINIFSVVPSIGRFYSVAYILLGGVLFVIMNKEVNSRWNSRMSLIVTPVFILFVLIQLRTGFDFIGLGSLILNPLICWGFENTPALVDLYK